MQRPTSIWKQYEGKAGAELFKGTGRLPKQPYPIDLEPPFDEYEPKSLTAWDCVINGWEAPATSSMLEQVLGTDVVRRSDDPFLLPEVAMDPPTSLQPVTIQQFAEDETTVERADQLLRSLVRVRRPVSFEVVSVGTRRVESERRWEEPYTLVQFVAHQLDTRQIAAQLSNHYPNSGILVRRELDPRHDTLIGDELSTDSYGGTLVLDNTHCHPLRCFSRLDPDPLAIVLTAFDNLGPYDWAMLQVLFEPVSHDWFSIVRRAVEDPYGRENTFFREVDERMLEQKFSSPLFAVSIHLPAPSVQCERLR